MEALKRSLIERLYEIKEGNERNFPINENFQIYHTSIQHIKTKGYYEDNYPDRKVVPCSHGKFYCSIIVFYCILIFFFKLLFGLVVVFMRF